MAHQPIEELEFFLLYELVADRAWDAVNTWPRLAQNTLGEQLIRAIDSVNANLAEGDGRYAVADSLRFLVIARGSARESRLWIRRASKRKLIDDELASSLIADIEKATRLLNLFINYRRKTQFVKEESPLYLAE